MQGVLVLYRVCAQFEHLKQRVNRKPRARLVTGDKRDSATQQQQQQ
jgi:hypothetical protein